MHTGISLRTYPRSDTKLSRPHPDTTPTVAPDSGTRTISEFQTKLFQNSTCLPCYNFAKSFFSITRKGIDSKMSTYKNFSTGFKITLERYTAENLFQRKPNLDISKDVKFLLRKHIKVLSYFENPFQHTHYSTFYMQSISLTTFHTILKIV